MSNEIVFRSITLALLLVGYGASGYFRRKADREGGELDQSKGQGLLVVLRLLGLLAVAPLIGYLINPSWVAWARFPAPVWLRWIGVGIAVADIPFLVWVLSSIQNNISPTQATREGHQLVTKGPYRWIRHPLYTGGTVFYLALTFVTRLWWLAAGMVVVFAVLSYRTPKEEAELVEKFGNEYRAYQRRTGRYLPKIG